MERRAPGSGQQAVERAVEFFGEVDALRAAEDQPMLAEPWERLFARAIDVSIVFGVFMMLSGLYLYPGAERPDPDANIFGPAQPPPLALTPPSESVPTLIAQTLFVAGLFLAYELLSSALLHVTVGKRIFNLEVHHSVGGGAVPLSRLLVRSLAWVAPLSLGLLLYAITPVSLLLLGPLVAGFILMARDDHKRAWYDRLSGTVVVKPR